MAAEAALAYRSTVQMRCEVENASVAIAASEPANFNPPEAD